MGYSIEQAQKALGNPNVEGRLRQYFIAIIEGRLPEYYFDLFLRKKTDYSDDLPDVDVRTLIDDPQRLTQYKCQGNYILGLTLNLRQAITDGVIRDEALTHDITGFVGSDLKFQIGDPSNTDRISRINNVLDRTIAYLTPHGSTE